MPAAKEMPSIDRLRELFSYDPASGIVFRRKRVPHGDVGDAVGTRNVDYALICRVDYRIIYVHRLAWMLYYGEEPPPIIDHINGICFDNRIANLRAATTRQNGWNRKASRHSKSGMKGAHWSSSEGKWRSSIKIGGKKVHLGWFKTKDQAASAYREAAMRHYGEFARTG